MRPHPVPVKVRNRPIDAHDRSVAKGRMADVANVVSMRPKELCNLSKPKFRLSRGKTLRQTVVPKTSCLLVSAQPHGHRIEVLKGLAETVSKTYYGQFNWIS